MDFQINVHHLVPLRQMKIADNLPTSSHPYINPELVTGGIVDDNDTNYCTFHVLNTLVSLCISKETHQVVALALQVCFKEKHIRIIIAKNNNVNKRIVQYIFRV